MPLRTSPRNITGSVSESFYDVVDALCGRFQGLSPFEVMDTDMAEVYELYVAVIIHDFKEKKKGKPEDGVWVTSKTATWH